MINPAYKRLKPAEKAFVDSYVADLESAAVKAGLRLMDALDRASAILPVDAASREFLERPLVQAAIEQRIIDIQEAMAISAHRLLKEVAAIAFSSMADYVTVESDGYATLNLAPCTPEQMSAVKKFKLELTPRGGQKIEIELYDKQIAQTNLLKCLGVIDPDNPYWSENAAKKISQQMLPKSMSLGEVQNAYDRMINSQAR